MRVAGRQVGSWLLATVTVLATTAAAAAVVFSVWPRDVWGDVRKWDVTVEAYHYPDANKTGIAVDYERTFRKTFAAPAETDHAAENSWKATLPNRAYLHYAGLDVYRLPSGGGSGSPDDTDATVTLERRYKYGVDVTRFWLMGSPAAVAALASFGLIALRRNARRHADGHCRQCGYDLRATPGRCPECGAAPV